MRAVNMNLREYDPAVLNWQCMLLQVVTSYWPVATIFIFSSSIAACRELRGLTSCSLDYASADFYGLRLDSGST